MKNTNRGKFIVFEGCEGSGKSTQLELLAQHLESAKIPVFRTKEPGGTPTGHKLREIVLHDTPLNKVAELLLYAADRANHVEIIKDCLDSGYWVLCDRFTWSTIAYQGYGRGHSLGLINYLNDVACQGLKPDWTILLDIDPKIGLARKYKQGETNKFEAESLEFHNRVRNGYKELFLSVGMWEASTRANLFYCQSRLNSDRQVSIDVLHNMIVGSIPFDLKLQSINSVEQFIAV
jgi:dTMP kinase